MKITLKIEDNTTMKGYEVHELVTGTITCENALFDSVGKLEFELVKTEDLKLANGNKVEMYVDDQIFFVGYIFKFSTTNKGTIKVTSYNQLRYLKYKDTMITDICTASELFVQLCQKWKIKYMVIHPSNYKMGATTYQNKSLYEMLTDAIDKTLVNEGKWYGLIEYRGTLQFADLEQLATNVVIGDGSLASGYEYECSIDDDTYNIINLGKDDSTTGSRKRYVIYDSDSINKWGMLQYHEIVDENMNEAQIKQRAEMLMKVKNRETKTLKVSCMGNIYLDVGKGVMVKIKDLEEQGVNGKVYLITESQHKFSGGTHTMDLTLQLIGA